MPTMILRNHWSKTKCAYMSSVTAVLLPSRLTVYEDSSGGRIEIGNRHEKVCWKEFICRRRFDIITFSQRCNWLGSPDATSTLGWREPEASHSRFQQQWGHGRLSPRIYRQRSERTRFRLLFRFFTKISWNELEYPERRSHFLRDKAQHYGN